MPAVADRVRETTTTTGTGNLTLAGAVAQHQSFNTAFGTGVPFYYCIIDADGVDWEVGTGELSDATTLVRTTVHASTNSDTAISLSAGTHQVFCTIAESLITALQSVTISDTAYGSGWNGVTTVAPSKNAVYDQMELKLAAADAVGKQTIWVPAGAMTSRTTNGAAAGSAEMTTNKNMVVTKDFDATTQEFVQFEVAMPKSWNEGTVTFIPYWSHPSTATNFGVVWGMDAVAISDDDTLDVAFGTEQTSTDTGGTTNDLYVGPESSAITAAGTPAAGDLVMFRVHRNPSDGSDTLAVDARLHGVKLLFTTDATTDA